MTILSPHTDWTRHPLGRLGTRSKAADTPELEPLSVFLGAGVVRRAERQDNHNALGADMSKYLTVHPGDLVVNKLRAWQGGLGVSPYAGVVSPAYFIVRFGPLVHPKYVHYLLLSQPYLAEITRLSKWMPPSQFDLAWEDLAKITLYLPPVDVQRRIADFLDDQVGLLDQVIRIRQKQLDLLQSTILSAAYESVFAVGRAPRKDSSLAWASDLPEHWDVVGLRLVAKMGTGHTPSRSEPAYWVDCDIPWLTTADVKRFRRDEIDSLDETAIHISQAGIENSSAVMHPAGTVALSRTASAGFSIVMDRDMATSQDFVTWAPGPRLRSHYLLWCLRVMRGDLLGRLAMGSTHKTIYFPDLEGLRIPLPPLDEQDQAIDEMRVSVARIRSASRVVKRALTLLEERKRALITAAVTGEIDVTTASARGVV